MAVRDQSSSPDQPLRFSSDDPLMEVVLDTQTCIACGVIKVLTDFRITDGYYRKKCKKCENSGNGVKHKEHHGIMDRKCTCCGEVKQLDAFYEKRKHLSSDNPSRYFGTCIECTLKQQRDQKYLGDTKVCSKCLEEKPVDDFHRNRGKYHSHCKGCTARDRKENKAKYQRYNKTCKDKIPAAEKRDYKRKYRSDPRVLEMEAAYSRNRRARLAGLDGFHTADDIVLLYFEQLGRCVYCKEDLVVTTYHVDHIVPISRIELNPTNFAYNLQLLCPTCNCTKHNKTEDEFIEYLSVAHPERYQKYLEIYGQEPRR